MNTLKKDPNTPTPNLYGRMTQRLWPKVEVTRRVWSEDSSILESVCGGTVRVEINTLEMVQW